MPSADTLIGIVGKDFVLMAADSAASRSIQVLLPAGVDKMMALDSHKILAGSGDSGDRVAFSEFIQKNIALYQLRTGVPLSVHAAANFARNELAIALRRDPFNVNFLLGGFSEEEGPALYFMDYLASLHRLDNFGVQGYAQYFVMSILDKNWRPDMDLAAALALLHRCVVQLKQRFVLNASKYIVKVATKDGIRILNLGTEIDAAAAAAAAAAPAVV